MTRTWAVDNTSLLARLPRITRPIHSSPTTAPVDCVLLSVSCSRLPSNPDLWSVPFSELHPEPKTGRRRSSACRVASRRVVSEIHPWKLPTLLSTPWYSYQPNICSLATSSTDICFSYVFFSEIFSRLLILSLVVSPILNLSM